MTYSTHDPYVKLDVCLLTTKAKLIFFSHVYFTQFSLLYTIFIGRETAFYSSRSQFGDLIPRMVVNVCKAKYYYVIASEMDFSTLSFTLSRSPSFSNETYSTDNNIYKRKCRIASTKEITRQEEIKIF